MLISISIQLTQIFAVDMERNVEKPLAHVCTFHEHVNCTMTSRSWKGAEKQILLRWEEMHILARVVASEQHQAFPLHREGFQIQDSTAQGKPFTTSQGFGNCLPWQVRPKREKRNAWERDIWRETETFYRDLSTIPGFLPWLGGERNATRDDLEERSVCDTLSSFPCSSPSLQSSMCYVDNPVDRKETVFHFKFVLNWMSRIGNTSYFKLQKYDSFTVKG